MIPVLSLFNSFSYPWRLRRFAYNGVLGTARDSDGIHKALYVQTTGWFGYVHGEFPFWVPFLHSAFLGLWPSLVYPASLWLQQFRRHTNGGLSRELTSIIMGYLSCPSLRCTLVCFRDLGSRSCTSASCAFLYGYVSCEEPIGGYRTANRQ
jgi:hypothetical protein